MDQHRFLLVIPERGQKLIAAGGPALTIFACAIPTSGAPSLRFLQGWAAMLRVLSDFAVDVDQTQLAPTEFLRLELTS
jgi:hypothetical protein